MESQGSPIARASQYLSDSVDELKKVSSPTRQETIQATIVTVLIIVFLAVTISLMDLVFQQLMKAVIG